jgi:hypothetical protein
MFAGVLPMIYPIAKREFGITNADVGLLTLAYTTSSSLLQPLFGHLADRWRSPWIAPAILGLIETAVRSLEIDSYSFQHNYPFKGGFITRYFGRPGGNQHALQLEMTKVNYMKDDETRYDQERAENIRKVLIKTFESLQAVLQV